MCLSIRYKIVSLRLAEEEKQRKIEAERERKAAAERYREEQFDFLRARLIGLPITSYPREPHLNVYALDELARRLLSHQQTQRADTYKLGGRHYYVSRISEADFLFYNFITGYDAYSDSVDKTVSA
jgi:hypothetical protein